MSQQLTLTLELTDETVEDLRRQADEAGLPLADLVTTLCQKTIRSSTDTRTEAQKEEARQRFRRLAGSVDLGYPTGADNDSIDRDLARAYANEY